MGNIITDVPHLYMDTKLICIKDFNVKNFYGEDIIFIKGNIYKVRDVMYISDEDGNIHRPIEYPNNMDFIKIYDDVFETFTNFREKRINDIFK
jgi:uncharacterized protein YxjI